MDEIKVGREGGSRLGLDGMDVGVWCGGMMSGGVEVIEMGGEVKGVYWG